MAEVRLFQVNSFTQTPFTGNPAGVVLGADALSDDQMQAIARELNNSETAFVLAADSDDHDIRIRFFTPTTEVPSCGHATLATHYVRAAVGEVQSGHVRHKIGAGLLGADVENRNGDYFITVKQRRPEFAPPYEGAQRADLIAALGLTEEEIAPGLPLQWVDTGHPKVLIPVRSRSILDSMRPDAEALKTFHRKAPNGGYFVFTLAQPDEGITCHARMFGPNIGIVEDPVTGNGNGPTGAYLVHHGVIQSVESTLYFRNRQGEVMGRPGEAHVWIGVEDGYPASVRVGGHAVILFEAMLKV